MLQGPWARLIWLAPFRFRLEDTGITSELEVVIRDIIFTAIYGGVGLYGVLMLLGIVNRKLMKTVEGPRRLAIGMMCLGFLALGAYHALQFQRFRTPEGRAVLEKMRKNEGNVIIGPIQ